MSHPWNWCPHCKQCVDVQDASDDTDVECWGCDTVYTVTLFNDGSWELIRRDEQDDE